MTADALTLVLPSSALAFLEGIGAMEMMLVAVIGLLLFGGKGLPDMARTLGKVVREFKKATANVEEEVKRVMNEEPAPKPRARPRPSAPPPAASLPALSPSSPLSPTPPAEPTAPSAPTEPASDELQPPRRDLPPPA